MKNMVLMIRNKRDSKSLNKMSLLCGKVLGGKFPL